MKYVFAGAGAILVALSGLAWAIRPAPVADGRTLLTWTVDDNQIRQEQVALFNRLNPGLQLEVDAGNAETSKVIIQSLAGVGPDIFCCYSGMQLSAYVRSGIAWDITDELPGLGVDVSRDLWGGGAACMVHEGRVYGIANNVAVDALWCNRALFEECGVPFPENRPRRWEEFLPVLQKLTVRDRDGRVRQFGFLFAWWQWPAFMRQWGGRVYSADGTRCEIDCPETVRAVQFMQDLIYKHGVSPSPEQEAAMSTEGGWGSGTITWFGGGRAATALGGRWWLIALRKYPGLRLGVVESPHGERRLFHAYGKATLINRRSPRRREALAFLKYMLGREYNELINHQGDGLGPVKRHAFTETFLHDPAYPEEKDNGVWREVLACGVPEEISPFVNGGTAGQIITEQLDLVRSGQKPAAEAMRAAAEQVNLEIQRTLRRDPALRAEYQRRLARRGGAEDGR